MKEKSEKATGESRLSALIRTVDEDRRRRVNGAWQKVLMMTRTTMIAMIMMMLMMMYIKCRRA